ncbi:MAG: YoaK family protein, partial [Candidatus Tyrphobacter sp.]
MSRDDLAHLALAICLIAIAGYVDAVGFLKLGHFFVSFASGNSTQFAVGVSQGVAAKAGEAGGLVALFVIGVILGRLCTLWARRWRRPAILILDAALLGLAVLVAASPASIVAMALAMGIQNEALHKAGQTKTAVTYVTGALVNFGENIVDAFTNPRERWAWVPYLLLWTGLAIGAAIGAHCYGGAGVRALVWPTAALVVLTAITAAVAWFGSEAEKT